MKRSVDWGLYLVTDRQLSAPRTIEETVKAALPGGVSVVQLREKDGTTREFLLLALRLLTILRPAGVPLIINDRLDVAIAAGADGVHLGQSDLPYREARSILGPEAIIGLSVETLEQAREAEEWDIDYLAASPVFSTPTKTDTGPAWGLAGLFSLRKLTRHPLVAIGGINRTNAASVLQAGADGIAVVSALCAAPDPGAEAKYLREIIEQVRREGNRP
ncbi:MAG: thiamine phosphate synthase [Smithellaceae bacterium]|nr:thiamine phosphate synthase [Smithellaceae bacterium]